MTTVRVDASEVAARGFQRTDHVRAEDHFGRAMGGLLRRSEVELTKEQVERLRRIRESALKVRRQAPERFTVRNGRGSGVNFGGLTSAVLAASLAAAFGVAAINWMHTDRASPGAPDVDLGLLTGPLPLAAFTDSGFAEYVVHGNAKVVGEGNRS